MGFKGICHVSRTSVGHRLIITLFQKNFGIWILESAKNSASFDNHIVVAVTLALFASFDGPRRFY